MRKERGRKIYNQPELAGLKLGCCWAEKRNLNRRRKKSLAVMIPVCLDEKSNTNFR